MNALGKVRAVIEAVDENAAGQRLDNFLFTRLKGVPKSHVYRVLRTGQVRVNSARVDAAYRLQSGDSIRIPPVREAASSPSPARRFDGGKILQTVIHEDDAVLVINKPAGLAVHGGSGIASGAIEQLRHARPELKFLELAHRLDRDTSGLLLLAKKRAALLVLHRYLREGTMDKRYLVLVAGGWGEAERTVNLPLHKYITSEGERRVSVSDRGKPACTIFRSIRKIKNYSLLEAELKTGRTHQLRVQLAHLGYPILGDEKYGDFSLNKQFAKQGLKRMFLHAAKLGFQHPSTGTALHLEAPLPAELQALLRRLSEGEETTDETS